MKASAGSTIQELSPTIKALSGDAARKLTGQRRRAFMAIVAVELLRGQSAAGDYRARIERSQATICVASGDFVRRRIISNPTFRTRSERIDTRPAAFR